MSEVARPAEVPMHPSRQDAFLQRIESLEGQYALHFHAQHRLTRDVEILGSLMGQVRSIVDELKGLATDGKTAAFSLLGPAEELAHVMVGELRAIEALREEAGPRDLEAVTMLTRARLVMHRYVRHFSGRPRRTRDLGMLGGIIEELGAIHEGLFPLRDAVVLEPLADDILAVDTTLETLKSEFGEVRSARVSGDPPAQAANLAGLANDLFRRYDALFGGRGRLTRRLPTLERMLGSLERIHEAMLVLGRQGVESPDHGENTRIIGRHIGQWRGEVASIAEAIAEADTDARLAALDEEVGTLLGSFNQTIAGRDRSDIDVDVLVTLCDLLDDLECELTDLAGAVASRRATVGDARRLERAVALARDSAVLMQREHDAVVAEQGAAGAQHDHSE